MAWALLWNLSSRNYIASKSRRRRCRQNVFFLCFCFYIVSQLSRRLDAAVHSNGCPDDGRIPGYRLLDKTTLDSGRVNTETIINYWGGNCAREQNAARHVEIQACKTEVDLWRVTRRWERYKQSQQHTPTWVHFSLSLSLGCVSDKDCCQLTTCFGCKSCRQTELVRRNKPLHSE